MKQEKLKKAPTTLSIALQMKSFCVVCFFFGCKSLHLQMMIINKEIYMNAG